MHAFYPDRLNSTRFPNAFRSNVLSHSLRILASNHWHRTRRLSGIHASVPSEHLKTQRLSNPSDSNRTRFPNAFRSNVSPHSLRILASNHWHRTLRLSGIHASVPREHLKSHRLLKRNVFSLHCHPCTHNSAPCARVSSFRAAPGPPDRGHTTLHYSELHATLAHTLPA